MHLLIIRHAIAVPRGTPGIPDADRPLTPEGEKKFRQAARGLARIRKRPDALLTSPWRRALQTAEIAAHACGRIMPTKTPALAAGALEDLAAALSEHSPAASAAPVGA